MGGWFVVNVADAKASGPLDGRSGGALRGREDPFPEFGVNIRVLQPGEH